MEKFLTFYGINPELWQSREQKFRRRFILWFILGLNILPCVIIPIVFYIIFF